MKNTLEGIDSRQNETKWVWQMSVLIIATEQKEKRMKTIVDSLRDLWDNTEHTNIHIIRVTGRRHRERG